MNSSTLRRLALDHSSLHTAGLPPYYLFPSPDASSHVPDDLTKLTVLLTGPQGTPYSEGLWKLCLTIPTDYPKSPPRAAFRTRIWHPNVEENTGHVCVDTLKRDWDPKLTLRDILVTITCLLIHPNPDSALNASAGHLLHDDYETFARQAHLMASIHARIPANLRDDVSAAKRRGEESDAVGRHLDHEPLANAKSCRAFGVGGNRPHHLHLSSSQGPSRLSNAIIAHTEDLNGSFDADSEDEASASKENDPSLSPSPVAIESPRISISTKRPLSDLPTPTEPECNPDNLLGMSSTEDNISINAPFFPATVACTSDDSSQNLKLVERSRSLNYINRANQGIGKDRPVGMPLDEKADSDDDAPASKRICSREEKENGLEELVICDAAMVAASPVTANGNAPAANHPTSITRKPTANAAIGSRAVRPRVGLRRL